MGRLTPATATGLAAGLLFFVHAMINDSNAWPLVWPILGGAAAVWSAARRERVSSFWGGLRAGAGSGALASSLFFVATAATLAAMGLLTPEHRTEALMLLAVAGGIGFALATVAGALAYPLARQNSRAI